jgi:hypothetical protein
MVMRDHWEILHSIASLVKRANPGATVTIFTTRELYAKSQSLFRDRQSDYVWVIKQQEETLRGFLKRIERHCDSNIDLLFVNTIYDYPHRQIMYYFFRPKCPSVKIISRVEYWFGETEPLKLLSLKNDFISVLHNISQLIRKRRYRSLTESGLKTQMPMIWPFDPGIGDRFIVCRFIIQWVMLTVIQLPIL